MNLLNLFVRNYARLHSYPCVPVQVFTPLRIVIRRLARYILPKYLAMPTTQHGGLATDIIVSLTSFPARINNVWQVIECFQRQSYKPRKIILWLSAEQFPNSDSIPQTLRMRESQDFEIRLVDGDIRSHKKYHYVAKEYADSLVFLVDDDIYYDTQLIERTVKAHEEYPDAIICNYAYHIKHDKDGTLLPYNRWARENRASQSDDLFFGSGGGTLFRPSSLHPDLTDIGSALACCPIADDIWLNAMVRLAGKPVVLLRNGDILPIYNRHDVMLYRQNQEQSMNDSQLTAVIQHYHKQIF